MNTARNEPLQEIRINATAVACSGFFLGEASWSRVRGAFSQWICVDECRENATTSLRQYVETALAAIAATPSPHILLAHSFGGWLAAAVAAKMARPPSHLMLLGAIGLSPGLSAVEHVFEAGTNALAGLCKLDAEAGRVALNDETAFLNLLGRGANFAAHAIRQSEPLGLLTEALDPAVLQALTNTRCRYLLSLDDQLTDEASQRRAAEQYRASVLTCSGGHLSGLSHPRWLRCINSRQEPGHVNATENV